MGTGSTRRLHVRHDKLWWDEAVELQFWLIVLNGIRSFQATDTDTVPKFHGIVVSRLLRNWELDDIRAHGTDRRATFPLAVHRTIQKTREMLCSSSWVYPHSPISPFLCSAHKINLFLVYVSCSLQSLSSISKFVTMSRTSAFTVAHYYFNFFHIYDICPPRSYVYL